MKTYQHILVGTNLSDESKQVADRAASLAKKSQAKLSIVHIVEFAPVLYGGGEFALPLTGDLEESIRKQAQDELSSEGARLAIPQNQQHLLAGVTAEKLVKLVHDSNADLLVLGSHEHRGLSFLLGSTANALLHLMPCDVLAVRI